MDPHTCTVCMTAIPTKGAGSSKRNCTHHNPHYYCLDCTKNWAMSLCRRPVSELTDAERTATDLVFTCLEQRSARYRAPPAPCTGVIPVSVMQKALCKNDFAEFETNRRCIHDHFVAEQAREEEAGAIRRVLACEGIEVDIEGLKRKHGVDDVAVERTLKHQTLNPMYGRPGEHQYRAWMCPRCRTGPVTNEACFDLAAHHNQQHGSGVKTSNACVNCGFYTTEQNQWTPWDGVLRIAGNAVGQGSSSGSAPAAKRVRFEPTGKAAAAAAAPTPGAHLYRVHVPVPALRGPRQEGVPVHDDDSPDDEPLGADEPGRASPSYSPSSPVYSPTSPNYSPTSPDYSPGDDGDDVAGSSWMARPPPLSQEEERLLLQRERERLLHRRAPQAENLRRMCMLPPPPVVVPPPPSPVVVPPPAAVALDRALLVRPYQDVQALVETTLMHVLEMFPGDLPRDVDQVVAHINATCEMRMATAAGAAPTPGELATDAMNWLLGA